MCGLNNCTSVRTRLNRSQSLARGRHNRGSSGLATPIFSEITLTVPREFVQLRFVPIILSIVAIFVFFTQANTLRGFPGLAAISPQTLQAQLPSTGRMDSSEMQCCLYRSLPLGGGLVRGPLMCHGIISRRWSFYINYFSDSTVERVLCCGLG